MISFAKEPVPGTSLGQWEIKKDFPLLEREFVTIFYGSSQ
jgi:hypothetical protein